mmetsp:Transcript_3297/g.13279  ORF Transcript_3297/g.13279 Transcript_3297/m.13279 type:complete len:362 (+) Transcript_3297:171-1256(+)
MHHTHAHHALDPTVLLGGSHDEVQPQPQAHEIQQTEHRHPAPHGFPKRRRVRFLPFRVFVDREEHGKRHEEINTVERASQRVRHVPIFEAVVREPADGQALHERGGVRHDGDQRALEEKPPLVFFKRRARLSQRAVGQDVVKHEVGVRHEVQSDGHVVQLVRVERVLGVQNAVEVVRVPVVPDEAEHGDPQVRLEDVPLAERLQRDRGDTSFSSRALAANDVARERREERHQHVRARARHAVRHVPPPAPPLVRAERDHHADARDPARGDFQDEHLRVVLGGVRGGVAQPPGAGTASRGDARARPRGRQRGAERAERREHRGEDFGHRDPDLGDGAHVARVSGTTGAGTCLTRDTRTEERC